MLDFQSSDGKRLSVPQIAKDITIYDWYEYISAVEQMPRPITEDHIGEIANAVQKLCVGNVYELPLSSPSLYIDEKFEYSDLHTYEDLCLYALYVHLQNVVNNYELDERLKDVEQYSYYDEVSGQTFYLYGVDLNPVGSLTVGESIVSSEIDRLDALMIEQNKGDKGANIRFSNELKKMAVLFRLKDEPLPLLPLERQRLIDNRAAMFQHFPITVAKEIDFFLTMKLAKSNEQVFVNIFLSLYRLTQQLTGQENTTKNQKPDETR